MKIVRYWHADEVHYGSLMGETIEPLSGPIDALEPTDARTPVSLSEVRLLAPTPASKIVAIGPGYDIMLEGRPRPPRPYYWIKPASAIQHPEGDIMLIPGVHCSHEAEIGIVIGRRARAVKREHAMEHVLGYTCVNDVTAGDHHDMPKFMQSQYFVDGKINDTFAPVGPVIVTDLDISDLRIQCRVNGAITQDHRTADRMWPYDELISMISHVMTLEPGDVIATGSPPGVAPMHPGDIVEVEVEGIGILRNRAV